MNKIINWFHHKCPDCRGIMRWFDLHIGDGYEKDVYKCEECDKEWL